MRKKNKRHDIEEQLLDTIIILKNEWQQIQSIVEKSIEPTDTSIHKQSLAQAKYLFLLREARHRKLNAKRYN